MRSFVLYTAFVAALAFSVDQAVAQEEGDPVSYTNGGVVYTAILDGDLDTVSAAAVSTVATAVTTTAAAVSPQVVATSAPKLDNLDDSPEAPSPMLRFQSYRRRNPSPQPPSFEKRQGGAALGGGGGVVTTQTGLQTISGYTPPDVTQAPSPTNYSSGTILQASQIPGYTDGKSSGSGTDVTSGGMKLSATKVAVASILGAIVFALV